MKARFVTIAAVTALAALLLGMVPLYAAGPPSIPQLFYGTVKVDHQNVLVDAKVGTIIEARLNNPLVGSILNGAFNPMITTQVGRYGGISPAGAFGLLVQGNIPDGAILDFYVDGEKANESVPFHAGGVMASAPLGGPTQLNLTAGAPAPVPVAVAPTVATNDATNVASNAVTLNATLSNLGTAIVVDVSFDWGTTSGGPYPNTTNVQTRTIPVTFSAPLTGLNPTTTYYFRARANGGAQGVSLGVEKSFTTPVTPPPTPTPTPTTTPAPTAPAGGGGGGSIGGGGGGGIPSPTPVIVNVWGTPTQYDINSDGRILSTITANTQDNKIAITLPAGTMAKQSTGSGIDRLFINPALAVPPAPPNGRIIGSPQTLEPSGATFDPPIVLVWSINPSEIPVGAAEKDLKMAFYDPTKSAWVPLADTTVDTVAHTVTGKIPHFTTFGIIATLPTSTPTATAAVPTTTAPPTTSPKPTQTPVVSPAPTTSAVPSSVAAPPSSTAPSSAGTMTVSVPVVVGAAFFIGMVFALLLVVAFRRRPRP